jgi:hypothetical protein
VKQAHTGAALRSLAQTQLLDGMPRADHRAMQMDNRVRFVCAALILAASAAAEDAARFAGAWKGEQAGKTYLLLSVASGSPLKIILKTSHIHVGESGEIDEIDGEVENEEKVLESKAEGATLYFKTEQGDGSVMEYRMSLNDDGKSALLRIVGAPDFVQPFRLSRS